MKFAIHMSIELSDTLAKRLIETGGIPLEHVGDQLTALSLIALTPIPKTLRSFLLAPGRTPIEPFTPTLLTTQSSGIAVTLTLHPGEEPWQAPKTPKPPRKTKGPKPPQPIKHPRRQPKGRSPATS